MLLGVKPSSFLGIITSGFYTGPSFAKIKSETSQLTSFSRFLLASLHMQSLKDKVSKRKVEEALAQLPRGSGSAASKIAYDETMNRIRGQEEGFRDLAIGTLAWISLAMTPLTLRELQCALSIEPGDTTVDEANFVDEEILSSVCAGLIVVDHDRQIVRLAHYTTQEYFESRKDVLFPEKQDLLAETCLTSLSFNVFSNWRFEKWGIGPPITPAFEFFSYAARHWHEHAQSSQGSTAQRLIIELLKRAEKLPALLREHHRLLLQGPLNPPRTQGLPIAARWQLISMVKALLHLEGYCAEDRSTMKAQALSLAAYYRQLSAVRILLDGNTIATAAVSHALSFMYTNEFAPPGSCEVVEVLLNHGAEPNTVFRDRPMLHYACWKKDVQFASLLLSHGADVELRDADGETALHASAGMASSVDIVKLLLEYKLDINAKDNDGETAMWAAMAFAEPGEQGSYWRLGTQLLKSGASVD